MSKGATENAGNQEITALAAAVTASVSVPSVAAVAPAPPVPASSALMAAGVRMRPTSANASIENS